MQEIRKTIRLDSSLIPEGVNFSKYVRETLELRAQGELCLTNPSLGDCPHVKEIEQRVLSKAVEVCITVTENLHKQLAVRNEKLAECLKT